MVVVHRKACPVVYFSTVREAEQDRSAVAAKLNVGLALVVEQRDEHLQGVELDIADHACFVVAVANERDVLGVGLEPLHRVVYDGLQVVALIVFRSDLILAPTWITAPLHEAERVAVHDDLCASARGFVKVAF